jgi:ribosome-associated protein
MTYKSKNENEVEPMEEIPDYANLICNIIDQNKGEDIVVIDLTPVHQNQFFFIVGTALSSVHLKKISSDLHSKLKEIGHTPRFRSNDQDIQSGWIALDYGDVIIHLFIKETRELYNLEGLWKKAKVSHWTP